jgi:peptide/nickel transport system substrate-binding protein
MTAQDVAFTILLSKTDPGIYYSTLGSDVKSVMVTGPDSLVVHFTHPAAEDWQSFLYQDPILPQHIMGSWSNTQLNTDPNATKPVGSGPMTLYATNSTEVVWKTDSSWWATKDLGVSFPFTYEVDTVNSSNGVELSDFLANEIDLSNNFLPGITTLISSPATSGGLSGKGGYGGLLSTYLTKPPYMLSANTVWLEPNLTKAPTNNLYFRKAVAYAINTSQIASVDYTNMVDPANPTGLMPSQSSYIDTAAVKQYGFSYNPTLAKEYLAKSGYKGQLVTIECPDGWTDWMAAIDLMVKDLAAVGIHAKAYFPSFTTRETNLQDAKYDFSLDNNASIAADPYPYFYREFRLPISKVQTATYNWERDNNPAAWALVKQLNTLPMTDKTARQAVFNKLETIELQTLPEIPLWYNGAWAQFNSSEWTHWPGANKSGDQYTPVMWAGWLGQMTTVLALSHISLK